MTATSSNYFTVALGDDLNAEQTLGKAEIRKNRIAAAVERSKGEYQREHAYTERGSSSRSIAPDQPKSDRHQLEFLMSAMYGKREYAAALCLLLDRKGKGPVDRELMDTGLRCAILSENTADGVELARQSRGAWRGQWAGLACAASDIFKMAGLHSEALDPLLSSCASFALHEQVLSRLHELIAARDELADLASLIAWVKSRKRYQLRNLFGQQGFADEITQAAAVDVQFGDVCGHFEERQLADLRDTLARLHKASIGGVDDTDLARRVREL